jgi:hypothetical protein
LFQTILDGFSLRQFLTPYNENHILAVDEEGEITIKKNIYMFKRGNKGYVIYEALVSRIEKLLSNESIQNVSVVLYCPRNYYQYFPGEKALMLKEDFWGPSFEDYRAYGLNIPKRLDMKRNLKQQEFITTQEIDICEIAWY